MNNRTSIRVAKEWFLTLGHIALWYAAIVIIVNIVMKVVSFYNLPGFNGNELFNVASAMSYIFMLVIGIVLPLMYQKYYVSLGVPRRQMTLGMLLGVVILACIMAAAHAGIYAGLAALGDPTINSEHILLQLIRDIVLLVFYYLLGWLICWGFTWGRFVTAASSILVGVLVTNGATRLLGDPVVVMGAASGPLPEYAVMGILTLATVVLALVLITLMKRVPIKAS